MSQPDKIEVLWLVESVCLRPKWYTAKGTLEEVLCYLAGVYAGFYHFHHAPVQREHAIQAWYDFLRVQPGLLWPTMREWEPLYRTLRARYQDDQAALQHLAHTYCTYRRELEGIADGD